MGLCRFVKSQVVVHKRVGHVVANYKQFILVWAGFTGEKSGSGLSSDYCPPEELWLYNCHTEVWSKVITTGDIPLCNSGSTGLVLEDHLYVYGGIEHVNDMLWRYSTTLYRLDLKTLVWKILRPSGRGPLPCDKGTGWVLGNRLYFFGGYGERPPLGWNWEKHSLTFSQDGEAPDSRRGWNNQLVSYRPVPGEGHGEWEWVQKTSGTPGPRAAAAADTNEGKAYLFGGRIGSSRTADLYAFDPVTDTWSHNLGGFAEIEGRSWHSLDFVSKGRGVVYGGLGEDNKPCSWWWEVNLSDKAHPKWTKHRMPRPLVWHQAAPASSSELIVIGGVGKSPYAMRNRDHVKDIVVIQFEPLSLFRLCLRTMEESIRLKDLEGFREQLPTVIWNVLSVRLS